MRFLIALLALMLVALTSHQAGASVKRSVSTIAWSIGQANRSLPKKLRTSYATTLKQASEKFRIDPFTIVAIIWHESHWRASAIGDGGEAIGLGQIHYRHLCKKDPSRCESVRLSLLNGSHNIAVVAQMINTMRRYCRRVTGKPALLARWLHAYGYRQKENLKCNMRRVKGRWRDRPVPTELRRIIRYRKQLIRKLQRNRRQRRRGRR